MQSIFGTLRLEENKDYVQALEDKYKVFLPPIFKAFVQTFVFGKMVTTPQHFVVHSNPDLGFDGMDEDLEKKFVIYCENGAYYQTSQSFPIIPSGIYASGFCVGLAGPHQDKILINDDNIENEFKVISPNILQFFSELKEICWDEINLL